MKYVFIPLLLIFFFVSCQNGCGTGANTNGSDNMEATDGITNNNSGLPTPANTADIRGETPQEQRVFDMYAKDFWIVTGYHKIGDKPAFKRNRGRWYKFNNDGTFTVGHYDQELSRGNWRLEQQASHIRLDAENDEEDGLWRMQARKDETMLVWIGTEEYETNSVQQRLENLLFTPKSPKEMGWDQE